MAMIDMAHSRGLLAIEQTSCCCQVALVKNSIVYSVQSTVSLILHHDLLAQRYTKYARSGSWLSLHSMRKIEI